MGDYFHPWRRKFGVATLMIACALTLGWERSLHFWDCLEWELGSLQVAVESHDNHLLLSVDRQNSPFKWAGLGIETGDFMSFSDSIGDCHRRTCLLCSAGIRFRVDNERCRFAVPYALIVVPLSLVSVYLLLGNRN